MAEAHDDGLAPRRARREPPPLRLVTVSAREELSPRLLRLSVAGSGLRDLPGADPAASVRLLVPSPGDTELIIPVWNGNEFLLPDGERPILRTFTPLRHDRDLGRLDIEIVRHPGGAVSGWAEEVRPGAAAAISGPGRGYPIDPAASRFVLIGDETALPAISQLLDALPATAAVDTHVEVVSADAVLDLPIRAGRTTNWYEREPGAPPGAALVAVVAALGAVDSSTRIWAAGEAASMQAIRTLLFEERGIPRGQAVVRGYWKPVRTAS